MTKINTVCASFGLEPNIGGRRQEVRQWLRGVSDAYGAMVSESNLLIVP